MLLESLAASKGEGAASGQRRAYVGSSYDDSDLDYGAVAPSRSAWRAGDHRLWCLVNSATYRGGRGSVRNSHA